jgi:hypothetical protein
VDEEERRAARGEGFILPLPLQMLINRYPPCSFAMATMRTLSQRAWSIPKPVINCISVPTANSYPVKAAKGAKHVFRDDLFWIVSARRLEQDKRHPTSQPPFWIKQ